MQINILQKNLEMWLTLKIGKVLLEVAENMNLPSGEFMYTDESYNLEKFFKNNNE